MINRVLIRIKVVQLLYSYFLVQNNFSVQSSPESPTKEKRFAYALYLDYLYLLMKVADSLKKGEKRYPLAETRFMKRLSSDNIMKSLKSKYYSSPFILSPCVDDIVNKVAGSSVYKKFLSDPMSETSIWPQIFKLFVASDTTINAIAQRYDNYSMRGLDRAKEMVEQTFSDFASSQDNIAEGIAELKVSLDKARELYFRLLMLPVEITDNEEIRLDERRHRYFKNEEDLNPNPKFIDNELVKLIRDSDEINAYAAKNKISWIQQDPEIIRHLLSKVKESDLYKEYMADPMSDLHADCEFWKKALRNIIFTDEEFLEMMEKKSVYWNDDFDIMGEFVIKTFRRFEEMVENPDGCDRTPVLPMYKDAEDSKFGSELFEATVRNAKQYREYIDNALDTQHWESERLAYMDVVIMETALAEIFTFPKIPIKASLNEYIEIAKSYSSAKSGAFINGMLGTIINDLKESDKLRK